MAQLHIDDDLTWNKEICGDIKLDVISFAGTEDFLDLSYVNYTP